MNFDVAIVGGGLVGASLALALAESGLKLALVDDPLPAPEAGEWDSRVYAISPGNAAFLESCGVWSGLGQSRIAPVARMCVRGDDGASRLAFSAYDFGLPELAFIVENRLLARSVAEVLARQKNLTAFRPARGASLAWGAQEVRLDLDCGKTLSARLVVGADGTDSWVRSEAGIGVKGMDYGQLGVVANFQTEMPHGDTARQWLRQDGVLALLPLPGMRVSMVWSAWEEEARALLSASPLDLCERVMEASHGELGKLQLITPAAAFPLRFLKARELARPRLALIGDAAHTVHPLAGQGVNLGLRGARGLATALMTRGPQGDCGDFRLLRRYERAHKEDLLAIETVTHGLQRLFNNTNPLLAWLRNTGLRLTDGLGPFKLLLAQRALG